ncbi:hypothetical protein [Dickeya dianthicola]|nr:hypothetical protein [Dickeya dianthicola]MBI0439761.1 hypothetical protein [Dickeya dianthicola]MBI0450797.1 hypothetical protein [Dickeya dianthicola]MBI0455337.1 hypothetical protein [Dickeya dianthicola]MBI0459691.1 hypothetical protein [Dickeya dianthicola]MBI0468329.1 hypothetical protein [Dickeya dianthicola]
MKFLFTKNAVLNNKPWFLLSGTFLSVLSSFFIIPYYVVYLYQSRQRRRPGGGRGNLPDGALQLPQFSRQSPTRIALAMAINDPASQYTAVISDAIMLFLFLYLSRTGISALFLSEYFITGIRNDIYH